MARKIKPRITYICQICKKSFQVVPWRKDIKYCSRKCYYISEIGFKHSLETRRKIGKSHKGIPRSEEVKRKISIANKGSKHPNWKGGRKISSDGYIAIHKPEHYLADKQGYVFEHRLVVASFLKRKLKPTEVIHHIDSNRQNNKPSNLCVFPSRKAHMQFHGEMMEYARVLINKTYFHSPTNRPFFMPLTTKSMPMPFKLNSVSKVASSI